MNEQQKSFQIGDRVIHWAYGPGEILQLDEKTLSGRTRQYYKVKMSNLMLWVPVEQTDDSSLRPPTPKKDFEGLFQILSSTGKSLPSDRNERRLLLIERLKDHDLASICGVIRDLTLHKQVNKMNESDTATLERSRDFLTYEWSEAFLIPVGQAEKELTKLLEGVENSK
jgi:RNA polymerase-interacting CarD/CdnL/TRCF family regulator